MLAAGSSAVPGGGSESSEPLLLAAPVHVCGVRDDACHFGPSLACPPLRTGRGAPGGRVRRELTGSRARAACPCRRAQVQIPSDGAGGSDQPLVSTYEEADRVRGALSFQRLLDGIAAGGALPPVPRRARSVSPSRRAARLPAHQAADDSIAHALRAR